MPWDFWLIFATLLIVIPLRGRARLQSLLAMGHVGSKERIILYLTTAATQWALAIVVAGRALARGLTAGELGLGPAAVWNVLVASALGAAILGTLHGLNLRRVGKLEGPVPGRMRLLASKILPQSTEEMLPYFALAITAGVCEEFLYRGFAMAALTRAGLPTWLVVVLAAILFGLAHSYQGKSGIAATSLLGLVLGGFRVLLGSLIPLAIWHATVDLVAGAAGRKYLMSGVVEQQDQ